jgi:arginyl-tRNA synthetase
VAPVAPEAAFRELIRRAARAAVGVEPESVAVTYPPKPELGDLASPVCFELARSLRRPPREIATAIASEARPQSPIMRLEVAGGGYLNAFLDRASLLRSALAGVDSDTPAPGGGKVIVEHTNINPNKAAHIGHLRNAVLGDTLVRFLRRLGRPVEVQNYIDDTGVQVADLVVGFQQLRGEELTEIEQRYAEDRLRERGERFDYLSWDLYAEVTRFYGEDSSRLEQRSEALHAMEQGDNPTAALAAHVARRMVQHHLLTMERIGVRYELLPHESDILTLDFWATAFERLKDSGAIQRVESGKNAGTWVMNLEDAAGGVGADQKVIVRSNGTVTYVGKDIAYQLWKFGLLGRDFQYTPFDWSPQEQAYDLWSTCTRSEEGDHPSFGQGLTVYNVIDTRQSYLQRVVTQGLRALGHTEQAERSIHYAYEMVALTPRSVTAMFPDYPLTDEERGKPYLEMSGRRGLGVRADDLLDTLESRAAEEVRNRNPDLDDRDVSTIAHRIAVGALRYYMLRFSRNRVVAFDLDAALAFDGETGPYLQYSVVRAKNILGKVAEQHGHDVTRAPWLAEHVELDALSEETRSEHWLLALLLMRSDGVIRQAVESLELSSVAKHAHVLAQTFNSFYHRFRVAQEADTAIRTTRVGLVRLYHDEMVALLGLMGIEVPERM